jgi:hypothetical protein
MRTLVHCSIPDQVLALVDYFSPSLLLPLSGISITVESQKVAHADLVTYFLEKYFLRKPGTQFRDTLV